MFKRFISYILVFVFCLPFNAGLLQRTVVPNACSNSYLAPVAGDFLNIVSTPVLPLDMYAPQQRFALNVERLVKEARLNHTINSDLVYDIMHTMWHLSDYELDIGVSNLIYDFGKDNTAYALHLLFYFYSGAGRDTVAELDRFGMTYYKFLKNDPLIKAFFSELRTARMHIQNDAAAFLMQYFPENANLFSVILFFHQKATPRFAGRLDFSSRGFAETCELLSLRHGLSAQKQEAMAQIMETMAKLTAPLFITFEETRDLYTGIEGFVNEVEQSLNSGLDVKGIYMLSGAETMMELSRQCAYHKGWTAGKFDNVFKRAGINMAVLGDKRDYLLVADKTKEQALRYLDQLGVLDGDELMVYDSGFKGTLVKFVQDLVRDTELVSRVLPGKDLAKLVVRGRLIFFDDSRVELWRDISGLNELNPYTGDDCRTFAWLTDDDAAFALAPHALMYPEEISKRSPLAFYEKNDGTIGVKFKGRDRAFFNTFKKQFLRIGQKHWNEQDSSYLLSRAA